MSNDALKEREYQTLQPKDVLQLRIGALTAELELIAAEKQTVVSELAACEKEHVVIQQKTEYIRSREDLAAQWELEDLKIAKENSSSVQAKLASIVERERSLKATIQSISSKIVLAQTTQVGNRANKVIFALVFVPLVAAFAHLLIQTACCSAGYQTGILISAFGPLVVHALLCCMACHKQIGFNLLNAWGVCGIFTLAIMFTSMYTVESIHNFAHSAKTSSTLTAEYCDYNFKEWDTNGDGILEMRELDKSSNELTSLVNYFYEIGHALRYEVNQAGNGHVLAGQLSLSPQYEVYVTPIYGISRDDLKTYPARIAEKYKNW